MLPATMNTVDSPPPPPIVLIQAQSPPRSFPLLARRAAYSSPPDQRPIFALSSTRLAPSTAGHLPTVRRALYKRYSLPRRILSLPPTATTYDIAFP